MSPSHRGRPSLLSRPVTWLLVTLITVLIAIGAIAMGGPMLTGQAAETEVAVVSAPISGAAPVSVEARAVTSSREELPALTTAA